MDHLENSIEKVLGSEYLMFYHPACPFNQIQPICTLEKNLLEVNTSLSVRGRDLSEWPLGARDQIARLLWVNWFHQRLPIEPIRKPILVHYAGDNKFVIDCGDTRLMTLSLLADPPSVAIIVTTRVEDSNRYIGWPQIRNNQELIAASRFQESAAIFMRRSSDKMYAIDWLEIGDQTTSHHMHDLGSRINMMQRYLKSESKGFNFNKKWAATAIDWNNYIS